MGKHGLASGEQGVQRSPIREKDKATFDDVEETTVAKKKAPKKTTSKKVAADVANDQSGSQEDSSGNGTQPDG